MTKLDLEAIRARCKVATPGPWCTFFSGSLDFYRGPNRIREVIARDLSDADQTFIAHARADVPALVAEVERLRAALAKALSETNEPGDFVELFGRFLTDEITT